jgi:hypothetical protein
MKSPAASVHSSCPLALLNSSSYLIHTINYIMSILKGWKQVQRSDETGPRSHSFQVVELGYEPRKYGSVPEPLALHPVLFA